MRYVIILFSGILLLPTAAFSAPAVTGVSDTKAYESDKSHWSMHQIRNLPAGTTKVLMSYYVRMDTSYGTESWKLAWLFDGDESGDREDDVAIPVRMQGGGWIIEGNANTELDPYGSFYPSDVRTIK